MSATILRPALLVAALLLTVQPAPLPVGLQAGRDAHPCKPLAPLRVTVTPRGDGNGPQVTLDVAIQPLLAMQGVTWRWELSPEVQPAGGELAGAADGARGALTPATLQLQVPTDGRYARAVLRVSGAFVGHDEHGQPSLERVEVEQLTSWGVPAAPAPVVSTLDAETGAQVQVVALPATLRSGP
ncbi:MAG TPA: hypothetical protein VFY71_03930 [Planctomycetota bacterium]|nr:hypothetical protein [Planctomycetota bacterium]